MPNASGIRDADNQIRDYFASNYMGGLPVVYGNVPYAGDPQSNFLRFEVRSNDSLAVTCGSMGNRRWRILGDVYVSIFAGIGEGEGPAYTYADGIAAVLRGIRLNNISFIKAPRIMFAGVDKAHYRVNVICPFQFDIIA